MSNVEGRGKVDFKYGMANFGKYIAHANMLIAN